MLRWLWTATLVGFAILAIAALTISRIDGWRFFAVGALAGLAAAAAGGALGLLFGLPITNPIVPASQRAAPRSGAAGQESRAESGSQSGSSEWFRDNTSMEQIADWLTKIIVGITLTQWASFQRAFDRMAAAVTAAMMPPAPSAQSPAMVLDAAKVAGGLVLAAYDILGFLIVYLWARRYLPANSLMHAATSA